MTIRPYKKKWQVDVPTPGKRLRRVVDTHAEAVELEKQYLRLRAEFGGYAALLMDEAIGDQFEKGLEKLKQVVEG